MTSQLLSVASRSGPQNFEDSPAHRDKSSPFRGLAVWHKDYPVWPIQILDTHPEEFSFIPHSCIAHQDNDVPEKVTSTRAPVASSGSHYQFPFRFIVKTKVSPMLFHHFDFRSVAIFHSSALCSIRRNVRSAQLAFAGEPGNLCGIWQVTGNLG